MANDDDYEDEENSKKKKASVIVTAASIIKKRFGREITAVGSKYSSLPNAISTGSILLDNAIGGCKGYPFGSVIEVFGWEGAGKTLMLYLAFAEAQRKYPDRPCVLIDAERQFQFQAKWAGEVGVDVSKLIVIPVSTAEETFDIIHALVLGEHEVDKKSGEVVRVINPGRYAIIGIDSVTQLVSVTDATKEMGQSRQRGSQATAIGLGLKKVTSAMARSDVDSQTILFFINQLRKNPNKMFGCMHASTKIHTVNDIYSSSSFVKHKIKEKMISYNEQTDSFEEFDQPLNYFNNGQADREDFIKICFEVPTHRMYQKFICTKNHEIYTKYGWVEAQDLVIGDELLSYCNNPLSIEEEQILIGSMLADGFMQTRGCLSASLSLANFEQPEYLAWKIKQLKSLKFYPTGRGDRVSFRSESEIFLLKYYKYFYENDYSKEMFEKSGKHYRSFTSEIIDKIDLLALAILYMDDGSIQQKDGKTRANVLMNRFKYLNENMIKELFESLINKFKQFGVEVELQSDLKGLNILNIQYFSKLISKYVIPEMQYKLLDEHIGNYQKLQHTDRCLHDKIYPKVIKICDISDKEAKCLTKYDIQTPTNSYMVGSGSSLTGIVVHNSADYRTGGNALPFYDTIAFKVAKIWKSEERDDNGEILSHGVKVTFEKNKAGSMPEEAVCFTLMHDGSGVNNEVEFFDVALMNGLLKEIEEEKGGKVRIRYNFFNPENGERLYDDVVDFSKRKFNSILDERPEIKEQIQAFIKDRKIFKNKNEVQEDIPDSAYDDNDDESTENEEDVAETSEAKSTASETNEKSGRRKRTGKLKIR